jgi:hypothetical protein
MFDLTLGPFVRVLVALAPCSCARLLLHCAGECAQTSVVGGEGLAACHCCSSTVVRVGSSTGGLWWHGRRLCLLDSHDQWC